MEGEKRRQGHVAERLQAALNLKISDAFALEKSLAALVNEKRVWEVRP